MKNNQDDPATTGKDFTGTWRGNWAEVLRPKFTSKSDSSPIWLQFTVEQGRLVGHATCDYIGLEDGPSPDVKELVVVERQTVPLFELRLSGNQLTFKRTLGQDVLESQLEIVGDKEAKLKTPEGEQYKTWLTLTRQ